MTGANHASRYFLAARRAERAEPLVIVVDNASKPIQFVGPADVTVGDDMERLGQMPFANYSVLDYSSFETTQYNRSLFLEFTPLYAGDLDGDVWLFVAFQRLPGPLDGDYDWKTRINDTS
ncbi:LOV-1 protein, partial [Aphelenchoides avenae]